jgi:hypothetical protein
VWKRGKFRTAYQPRTLRLTLVLPDATGGGGGGGGGAAAAAAGPPPIAPPLGSSPLDAFLEALHIGGRSGRPSTGGAVAAVGAPHQPAPLVCAATAVAARAAAAAAAAGGAGAAAAAAAAAGPGRADVTEVRLDYTKGPVVRGTIVMWARGVPRVAFAAQEDGVGVAAAGTVPADPAGGAADWKGDGGGATSGGGLRRMLRSITARIGGGGAGGGGGGGGGASGGGGGGGGGPGAGAVAWPPSPTFRFALVMPDRTWHLATDTPDDARAWLALLAAFAAGRDATLARMVAAAAPPPAGARPGARAQAGATTVGGIGGTSGAAVAGDESYRVAAVAAAAAGSGGAPPATGGA